MNVGSVGWAGAAAVSVFVATGGAEAAEDRALLHHIFTLDMEYVDPFGDVTPVVIRFESEPRWFGVDGAAGISNPIYTGSTLGGSNPIYEGSARAGAPWDGVSRFSMEIGAQSTEVRDGIVHRDLAARNILLVTDDGRFGDGGGIDFVWSQIGGEEYAQGVRTWVLMEPVTLGQVNARTDGERATPFWRIGAGSTMESTPVPAPGGAIPALALGAMMGVRRRR